MIGKVLGNRYRVLREVGSGGMAWVYLAEDIKENNLVAVKILYPQFGEDLAYIQRFNREAKLASTLTDPHIVRVLDYGADREVYYLVMEYISGRDLRDVLDEHGPFIWREALELLDQLGSALEHAHLHGIVHRDIKPQNLMLDDSGLLKVLDFGIARKEALPSLTQSGFIGSPYYVSPEQAMGEEVDIRSDIYSSSVVFYEMLSGKVPFEAKSPWSVISKHISSLPPPIEFKEGDVPETVQGILSRMGAKRAVDRFQTPTELRRAIAAVLAGQPIPDSDAEADQMTALYNRTIMADSLYHRAMEAIKAQEWARTVDLLSQVLKFNPDNADATEKLALAEGQASLQSLYNAVKRSVKNSLWQDALQRLNAILEIEPNYKDVKQLQTEIQQNLEREKNEQLVINDYEKGVAHFEAGRWSSAVNALQEVQRLYPGYKQTVELLAQAEEAMKQTEPLPVPKKQDNVRVIWWGSIIVLVVLVVLLGTQAYRITTGQDNLKELYQQAQQAKQAGNISQAVSLLDEIVKENPNYSDVATLRRELIFLLTPTSIPTPIPVVSTPVATVAPNKLVAVLKQAQDAIVTEQWTKAIDALAEIRKTDAEYEVGRVNSMLCDAYVGRGLETINNIDPQDKNQVAVVKTAQLDFETGTKECPKRTDLRDQAKWTTAYLSALNTPANDLETLIQTLNPLVAAEPNYASGGAKQLLYVAYLQRGDKWRQQKEMVRALSDYEAALDLKVADPSEAQTKRAELVIAISEPTKAPTPTKPPLPTPTTPPTPKRGETPLLPTPVPPTPTSMPDVSVPASAPLKPGPKLVSPANDYVFVGKLTDVYLEWEATPKLADDEYYDLTIMYIFGQDPVYWGMSTRDQRVKIPPEAGAGKAGNDRFYWWITIRKKDTAPAPDTPDEATSERSEGRTFIWTTG